MALKVVMYCQKCKEETDHWDNRENKRNPKGPDYKCITCGAGVWGQDHKEVKTPKPSKVIPILKPTSDFEKAYAKDILVAWIESGVWKVESELRSKDFNLIADEQIDLLQKFYKALRELK